MAWILTNCNTTSELWLGNGNLRRRFDGLKYALRRVEVAKLFIFIIILVMAYKKYECNYVTNMFFEGKIRVIIETHHILIYDL